MKNKYLTELDCFCNINDQDLKIEIITGNNSKEIYIISIIKNILTILSLTENNIKEIKNEKTFELSIKKMKKIVRYLQIKFILFFAFEFLFLILFWYYLSCFCTVYKNTQVYLIKNTSISFATSLLYPFGLNIIPCILRIPSLKSVKKDKECLYKISKIAQMI